MNIKYRVLYIDDEIKAYESLKNFAHSFNIKLIHSDNLEEGLLKLKSTMSYHGIILDARCSLSNNKTPKDSFLEEAFEQIKEIEKNKNCYFPIIIYSGYPEKFKSIYGEKYNFFEKDRDNPKDLFKTLIKKIKDSNHTKLELEYKEVFEIFNKNYLSDANRIKLLKIITDKDEYSRIQDNLISIRSIFTDIIKKIYKIEQHEDYDINSRNVSASDIINKLAGGRRSGKPSADQCYWSGLLESAARSIWFTASEFGKEINISEYNKIYPATIYTVQRLLFALFDIILWLKQYIEDKESVTWRRN